MKPQCSCYKRFTVGGIAPLCDQIYHHLGMNREKGIVIEIPNAINHDTITNKIFTLESYKGHDFYIFTTGYVCMKDENFEPTMNIGKARYVIGTPSRKEEIPEGTIFYEHGAYILLDIFQPVKLERICDE